MSLTDDTAVFEIDCAGGTYIRSVVATLKDAYCSELVRTRVGELRLEDADGETIFDPLEVLAHLKSLVVTGDQAQELLFGRSVALDSEDSDAIRLVLEGRLLGVGRVVGGRLASETLLAGSVQELLAR